MLEDKMSTSYLANGPILHPSPTNYPPNNLQLRTPQIFQFTNVKQEPIVVDDEKIDSGINSGGSDFQSSSPGSDQSINGDHHHYGNQQPQYCSTPKIVQIPAFPQQLLQQQQQQLLTPPNSEPLISPKSGDCDETTLTPCSSPGTISNHDDSEIGNNSDNNNDIKVPKVNSSSNSSKTKFMKCKQCKFVCTTKEVFWDHMKIHIREDKRLSCTQCNFVTEYKHHLEYHLRNHAGSKPFKCPNCNYTCVNKSMLNSHMKSHSNIYQYHCADCNYATKYCHSLKLHLRKHRHQPGLVLDQEGKPNPLPIIDVYGTRRGPKMKSKSETTTDKSKQQQQETTSFPTPFIPPQLSLAFSFLNQFPNPDVAAHLNQLILERQLPASGNETTEETDLESESSQGVLDLSQPSTSMMTTTTIQQQSRNRRKGPAFKFVKTDQGSDTENETNSEISVKEENNSDLKIVDIDDRIDNNNENRCKHCDMAFGDQVLYTLHMSLHGKNDPFTCNACGIQCENRIAFYVHITRYAH